MPSPASARSASSPSSSSPPAPIMVTSAPSRAAATAWLAPLPPPWRAKVAPDTVSPGAATSSAPTTRSTLTEPTTSTRPMRAAYGERQRPARSGSALRSVPRMPKLAAAVLALAAALAGAAPASAASQPGAFTAPCAVYGDMQVCSGSVPSFDRSKLDVDLTLPMRDTGTTHPLIVMLHGFGNDKHEWESLANEGDGADKYRWNSHWFAQHGYYVLTYTARGFRDDGPTADSQPPTPGEPSGSVQLPNGTIH